MYFYRIRLIRFLTTFRASSLNLTKTVKRRLNKLGRDQLSRSRGELLRGDNPEGMRLFDNP
jgi:hypothetical protein